MRLLPTFIALSLALAGCGDYSDGGLFLADARVAPATDGGGATMPGPESTEAILTGGRSGTTPPSEGGELDTAGADYASCFDGLDNDDNDAADCDDLACRTLGACRVGSGRDCRASSNVDLDFSACGDPTSCFSAAVSFGSPSSWIASGRLHPGGTDFDSGALFDDAIDLRAESLTLVGTFAPPTCLTGDACVETVAMGVTTQSTLTGTSRVTPVVALKLAGARAEMQLVVGPTVVRTFPFVATAPEWTLTLRPTGQIEVSQGGVSAHTESLAFTPERDAHVVVYGRNMNRAEPAPDGASLSRFGFSRALCDMPASWTSREPLALELSGSGSPWTVDRAVGVSAARVDGMLYLAFEASNSAGQSTIVGAFETSGGPTRFRALSDLTAPLLEVSDVAGAVALHDPEIVFDGSLFHLFFTVETGESAFPRYVGHASGPDLRELALDYQGLHPSTWPGLASIEMPTVVKTALGVWVIVARVTTAAGEQSLGTFTGLELNGLSRLSAGSLETLTLRTNAAQRPTFDSEEVAAPSLVIGGATFYLYYAGRRGTRWGTGLLATEDFLSFRNVTPDEPILRGRVGAADALGPMDTDVLIEGDIVTLFYSATDGATTTLFRATRVGAL